HPWPEFKVPEVPRKLPFRPVGSRTWKLRRPLALAAMVALCVLGSWGIAALFHDPEASEPGLRMDKSDNTGKNDPRNQFSPKPTTLPDGVRPLSSSGERVKTREVDTPSGGKALIIERREGNRIKFSVSEIPPMPMGR